MVLNKYSSSEVKKILFVVNLKSGLGSAKTFPARIIDIAEKNGLDINIYETTGKEDSNEIRRRIKEFNPGIVYAIGGDGTVNMVASELINTDIALGIFPAGSANGLAYNLGITDDVETELIKNLTVPPKIMDAIKINQNHFCFHLGDIGVNARIVSRFEKEGSKGMLGYGKQLVKEMLNKKTWFTFYIKIPGQPRRKMKAEMLVFANAKSYGTGAIINPTGKLNDGKFEIIVLRPYPWWFVFTFIYAVFTGKLHQMKYIKVFSAASARIDLVRQQEIQVDGEMIPQVKVVEADIIPGALKILPGSADKAEL
jgi:diacylglycerol kinase (ATP)